MGKTIVDISMSLDGFVTASNQTPEEPLGQGGQHLHDWAFGSDETNRRFLERAVEDVGAVIAGRRTYDQSIPWWGGDGPTGPARRPVFVVTHEAPSVPGRIRRCDASDGTVTNDWELRDDNGEWQPWRHTTMTRID